MPVVLTARIREHSFMNVASGGVEGLLPYMGYSLFVCLFLFVYLESYTKDSASTTISK